MHCEAVHLGRSCLAVCLSECCDVFCGLDELQLQHKHVHEQA